MQRYDVTNLELLCGFFFFSLFLFFCCLRAYKRRYMEEDESFALFCFVKD